MNGHLWKDCIALSAYYSQRSCPHSFKESGDHSFLITRIICRQNVLGRRKPLIKTGLLTNTAVAVGRGTMIQRIKPLWPECRPFPLLILSLTRIPLRRCQSILQWTKRLEDGEHAGNSRWWTPSKTDEILKLAQRTISSKNTAPAMVCSCLSMHRARKPVFTTVKAKKMRERRSKGK